MLLSALMKAKAFSLLRIVSAAVLAFTLVAGYVAPSLAAGGQTGNISGTITDNATKAPIANATITISSAATRSTQTTDTSGGFQFLGLPVDTYSVSISSAGYEPFTLTGITVIGDQSLNIGSQSLSKSLQTIGRTTARSRTSVFQPNATQDQVTVSGTRALVAQGKAVNVNGNALTLSVPGVQMTKNNRLTIRGGQANEVGYQLDGVPFTEPFLLANGNAGRTNGGGSLQVVEGAGDASQGNVGGGVVNVTIKRGARPAFGLLDFEATGPNFNHQFGAEYGFATPDGKISNYTSFVGNRLVPYSGPYNADPANVGLFFGTTQSTGQGAGQQKNNDLVNNFVFKFGKDNNQSLQVLYQVRDLQQYYGAAGPLSNGQFYTSDPYSYGRAGFTGSPAAPGSLGDTSSYAFFYNKVGITPNANPSIFGTLSTPFEYLSFPTRFVKVEYQNNLNNSTLVQLRTYNYESLTHSQGTVVSGSNNPRDAYNGGDRAGVQLDITKTLGDKNTLQFGAGFDNSHPIWNESDPYAIFRDIPGTPTAFGGGPSTADFLDPANINAPISAGNPCPVAGGCYVYGSGAFVGTGSGRIPSFGINYNKTDFQTFGFYVKDDAQLSSKLKLEIGARIDKSNYKMGANPYNPLSLSDPQDVGDEFISNGVIHPTVFQPRMAIAFQPTPNDGIRFSYGRSVSYNGGQTFGTPSTLVGVDPRLAALAPSPGTNLAASPATWTCGSGFNPKWIVAGGANATPNGGGFFQCQNYAQQLYWLEDQNNDAPDLGNIKPPTANNFDLAFQHQFKNGMAARLTGYFKREYNVPATSLVKQVLDPVTGAPTSQVFLGSNVGINKTSGLEFGFSLPDRPIGWTGYLSATYTNVIQSVPPLITNEDQVPLVTAASLQLGNTYRAGFVSPFVINAGAQYKTKSGWRFNPTVNFDRGFPIGVGNLTPSGATSPAGGQINGQFYNIPSTNIGNAIPGAVDYRGSQGSIVAVNYVDPQNPGNYFNPYINATRGTAETSSPGGVLSKPRMYANMSVEYTVRRNTFGVLVSNIFNNVYGEPSINPFYQPVATGISGPASGTQAAANPITNLQAYLHGQRNLPSNANPTGAYIELPNQAPRTFNFYYQLAL